ncbi:hypothetical protein [Croceicoccus marinus]|jgi:hypothetical protein|uniref:Uncharacterized protein n=1 Tax=Croceicoccus marinus TaxID=450378 RepID=A0A7G6VR03_9SPHN|nr:hypothetical protein [Croceicoccus marinus]QNE04168.1 hypothetical protein H4O24_09130 [Croceicoccus marinus]
MPAALPNIGHVKAGGAAWAIMLADLALILFIVTASYADGATLPDTAPDPVPQAIYRPSPGAPPLTDWIAQQPAGGAASLQITLGYDPADADAAMDRAAGLAAQAASAGLPARIVLIPGSGETGATLSFDR